MWTSTSKVIQSNEVQKGEIQLDLDFPKSITTSSCSSSGPPCGGRRGLCPPATVCNKDTSENLCHVCIVSVCKKDNNHQSFARSIISIPIHLKFIWNHVCVLGLLPSRPLLILMNQATRFGSSHSSFPFNLPFMSLSSLRSAFISPPPPPRFKVRLLVSNVPRPRQHRPVAVGSVRWLIDFTCLYLLTCSPLIPTPWSIPFSPTTLQFLLLRTLVFC
jgi:hypothetical protein